MPILGAQKRSFLWLVATLISILIAWPCPYSLATASTLHNSSETDRQALLCLKSQLSSPAGALDSWRDDSLSFCDWRGVSCSGSKAARVVALDLAELNITGKIPPCIADLHFIDTIDMAYNQINGPIPPDSISFCFLVSLSIQTCLCVAFGKTQQWQRQRPIHVVYGLYVHRSTFSPLPFCFDSLRSACPKRGCLTRDIC